MEREISETKVYTHPQLGRVKVEISDLETGFAFRLSYNKQTSEWAGYARQAVLDIANGQKLVVSSPYDETLAAAWTPLLVEPFKAV
jgi:hypothetical protein